jgi:hypothetical protein
MSSFAALLMLFKIENRKEVSICSNEMNQTIPKTVSSRGGA